MAGAEIEHLIKLLSRLPGLGPRSARRAVLHLVRQRETLMLPLNDALTVARDKIITCGTCGSIDTADPCIICADPKRDDTILCVVEDVADLWALERANATKGRYHVLGGVLSALDGVGPDDLNLAGLKPRCMQAGVKEIIIATNATVEGQSTAHYIMDMMADINSDSGGINSDSINSDRGGGADISGDGIKITRLAHGVPVGGELDYLDDGTLAAAVKSRREIE